MLAPQIIEHLPPGAPNIVHPAAGLWPAEHVPRRLRGANDKHHALWPDTACGLRDRRCAERGAVETRDDRAHGLPRRRLAVKDASARVARPAPSPGDGYVYGRRLTALMTYEPHLVLFNLPTSAESPDADYHGAGSVHRIADSDLTRNRPDPSRHSTGIGARHAGRASVI